MALIDTSSVIGNASTQDLLLSVVLIVSGIAVGNIARMLVVRLLKGKTSHIFYKYLSKIVMYSIYFFGFYFALHDVLDFDIPAFLAALGILGVTFLLTMLPVLQNMFAGLVISLERPFKEGDIIKYGDDVCIVRDIMLRKTILRSLDGKIIIVSNIKFVTGEIINYSKGEFIRVELDIDLKHESDYEKAIETINGILHEHTGILPNVPQKELSIIEKFFVMPKNPKVLEPKIFIRNVDKDKIKLSIWFWIWDILKKEVIVSEIYEEIMHKFKTHKISFG